MIMSRKYYLSIILTFLFAAELFSTPEFALWTGSNCSTCHVNLQGGGMRKEFGWAFGKDASLIAQNDPAVEWLYKLDKLKYSKFDSIFTYGMDFRLETFRSHKTPEAERRIIPMQASAYFNLNPSKWISFEGQYNVARKVFDGQTFWALSMMLQPFSSLPVLRIGRFQPSMGLRDCDMTSLDRRVPAPDGSEILISPDYSDIGFELVYNTLDWLQISAGAFDSRSLHEVSANKVLGYPSVVEVFNDHDLDFTHFFDPRKFIAESFNNNLSVTARFIFFPELLLKETIEQPDSTTSSIAYPLKWLLANFPASYFGGSTLVNGRFLYNNAFIGFALKDNLHTYFKFAYSNMPYVRLTNAYIIGLTYIPFKGVLMGFRAEHGTSEWVIDRDLPNSSLLFTTDQYVINAKIFLMPFLELIPEYRFVNTAEYKSSRWALQLHLFY